MKQIIFCIFLLFTPIFTECAFNRESNKTANIIAEALNNYNISQKIWALGTERTFCFMPLEQNLFLVELPKLPEDKYPEVREVEIKAYYLLAKINQSEKYALIINPRVYSISEFPVFSRFVLSSLESYKLDDEITDRELIIDNPLIISARGVTEKSLQLFDSKINVDIHKIVFNRTQPEIKHNQTWQNIILIMEEKLRKMIDQAIKDKRQSFFFSDSKSTGAYLYLSDFDYRYPDVTGYVRKTYYESLVPDISRLSVNASLRNDFSYHVYYISFSPFSPEKYPWEKENVIIAEAEIGMGNFLIWQVIGDDKNYILKRINFEIDL